MEKLASNDPVSEDREFFIYVESLLGSMQKLATARGEPLLVHLLELAKVEARYRASRIG